MPPSRLVRALLLSALASSVAACSFELESDADNQANAKASEARQPLLESALASVSKTATAASIGPDSAKRLYYQFIDDRGSVRFVERLHDVPPEWRARVGFVALAVPPPLTPMDARRSRDALARHGEARFASAATARVEPVQPRVLFYSAEWCGWCRKARAHMDREGIDYEVRDVDTPAALDELVQKTGQKGVPVFDIGGRILSGYDPDRLEQMVASR